MAPAAAPATSAVSMKPQARGPQVKAGAVAGGAPTSMSCSAPVNAKRMCVQRRGGDNAAASAFAGPNAVQAVRGTATGPMGGNISAVDVGAHFPAWCRPQSQSTRDNWCQDSQGGSTEVLFQTISGGKVTTDASATFKVIHQVYTAGGNYPYFVDEIGVVILGASGQYQGATVTGTNERVRQAQCSVTEGQTFAGQPLQPEQGFIKGAYYNSGYTAPGAQGECPTRWTLTIKKPGYADSNPTSFDALPLSCDNLPGARGPGCVYHKAPESVVYENVRAPELVRHVRLAQASGLPGTTPASALTKATQDTQDDNRSLACPPAPRLPMKSCDEYPPAASNQGLASHNNPGVPRRSFDNCGYDELPKNATGPNGVSVCQIAEAQNSYQGAQHSNFFRDWRVRKDDPWFVQTR